MPLGGGGGHNNDNDGDEGSELTANVVTRRPNHGISVGGPRRNIPVPSREEEDVTAPGNAFRIHVINKQ